MMLTESNENAHSDTNAESTKKTKRDLDTEQPKESKEITETAPATLTNPDGSAMPPRRGKQT